MGNLNKVFLLVDDDEDDRHFFQEAAKNIPEVRCEFAYDGDSALSMLLEKKIPIPDVIFLDVNMPRMGGLKLLRHIKNQPGFDAIPIYMYSTARTDEDYHTAVQLGATDYLIKPIGTKKIEIYIKMALRHLKRLLPQS